MPLVLDGESTVPGMSVEEVLVFTREAADLVKYIRGQDKSGWRSRLVNASG